MKAKAMAIRDGLSVPKDLGIRAVILEGDRKIILESFESSSAILSHNGLILEDSYRLDFGFSYFKAQFIPRACN